MFRHPKRDWLTLAGFLAAVFFYVVDRPAYRGYFSEDDLSTLSWAPIAGNDTFYNQLVSPEYSELNFRPVGSLYYRYAGRAFHLHYAPYVVVLQMIHILNVILLFYLLERLGFPRLAVWAAVLFYAFNAVVLEAYWKPMFVFDLLCATFCILALLLYVRGHWLAALIPFWLAYKSKEIAVMLPVALLAWEFLLGQRKWRRLIPYFLISLSFGLQALWNNRSVQPGNTYALHFAAGTVLTAARFYSQAMLHMPDLWVALLLLPLLAHDRRLWVGVSFMLALFVPLLFLPARLLGVYWYVPLIGLAIGLAAVASRTPSWAVGLFFLFWMPLNYMLLRDSRRVILAEGDWTRSLVTALQSYARQIPPVRAIVYNNFPEHLGFWGVDGAIRVIFGPGVDAAYAQSPSAKAAMARVPMALITFSPSPPIIRGMLRVHDGPQPYINFKDNAPESQLDAGWYDQGSVLRWTAPRAEAAFYRPAGATQFEIVATVPRWSVQKDGPSKVTVLEDGGSLGTVTFFGASSQPLRWKLKEAAPGDKHITIVSKPVRHGGPEDPRDLGIAVQAVGYVTGP